MVCYVTVILYDAHYNSAVVIITAAMIIYGQYTDQSALAGIPNRRILLQ